ncbi:MAG TPA: hypothetical protein VL625_06405 [Patescibacteria group bacterium]|nr:hypothetical protein [Patescibacteria group bacterium]
MKFEPEEFPIRDCFLQTGLPVDVRFDGFLDRARNGDMRDKYEFAYVLHSLALRGREVRPDVIPAEACYLSLQAALEIFEDIGNLDHAEGCLMAAKSWIAGHGCQKDEGKARSWLQRAEQLGCRNDQAVSNVKRAIWAAETRTPDTEQDLHHQYDQ